MSKPHILLVHERFCDAQESRGLSNSIHNLAGTLRTADIATYDIIHQDHCCDWVTPNVDHAIVNYVENRRPNLILISWLGVSPLNPKTHTLDYLKTIEVPTAILLPDTSYPWAELLIKTLSPYVTKFIIWDGTLPEQFGTFGEQCIALWTPQDPRLYYIIPWEQKDIDVSFVGSRASHYVDRAPALQSLRDNGINVYVTGGQREDGLSAEEYAAVIRHSKVTINFERSPEPVSHRLQLKGRVFEALACGTCLLESDGGQVTRRWLKPYNDFLPFTTTENLLGHIRDLQDRLFVNAQTIAQHGHDTYEQ